MKKYYPVALSIRHLPSIVIGGGRVAERKVLSLLDAGATVKVVSPLVTRRLALLAAAKKIQWVRRKVKRPDLSAGALIVAATGDAGVNKRVSLWAKNRGKLVNVVDEPVLCTFISPAVFRNKKAIIAVYTDGRDPRLSRDLKNYIKGHWDGFLSYRDRLSKG
jgi:precorrin-2 dehydrogenase/sirohydrochlorin ferrochelatase